MKIGVVQISGIPGDIAGNLDTIRRLAKRGTKQGCRLLLFPELSDIGYDFRAIAEHGSSSWGVVAPALAGMARSLGVCLACGVCLADQAGLANALVVWGTDGRVLAEYRKTHLFSTPDTNEARIFYPGDRLVSFDLDGTRFGLSICYDLRCPELFRTLTLQGCHALLMSAAWPMKRIKHWKILAMARAVENQCSFIGANRIGDQGAFPFGGQSLCVDPQGHTIMADERSETLLVTDLDMTGVQAIRAAIPSLHQRRPDLY